MDKDISKSEAALREEAVLEFWKESKIFQKSLEKEAPKGEFIFYEGPPTANGKPGIHHLEARAFKDAIPRYKTMRGYHVRRKGGWDTHGLPVELQVEKKLNLDSKIAIEKYGIAKFNQGCKESVWEYTDLWSKFTERIGYFVDQENAYVTYHNSYIESVWGVLKKIDEQNLLYKDYKVVPWCPRCGTVLSSHELAQGYEDVKDLSVTVKFKIKGQENTYILAWTTTPWTLPGNVALAVGEKIDYVKVSLNGVFLILAKARLSIIEGEFKIIEEIKGKDLIGLEYEPLYPFLKDTISESEKPKLNKAFKIYGADFVTTEDGTGVVHTAVMYGQDDFVLGTEIGLPKHHLVGLDGVFLKGTGFLEGRFVKDEEVAIDIIKDLANRSTDPLLFKKEKYEHSYPHCWRCKTALIYYARDSWYIKMSDKKIKDKMIQENKSINWEPSHIRDGRFGEWLKDIKDWAISRERYWGTPLPVWECVSCKKREVLGSLDEIKERTKKSGNKYFVMRHGQAESNLKNTISSKVEDVDHLTEKGKKQVFDSLSELKNKKIDFIISSDFMRTKETAEIIKKGLGISNNNLIFDKRIWELSAGIFDGNTWDNFWEVRENGEGYFYKPEGGESHKDLKLRVISFLYDLEKKYKDKNILIITHEGPARLLIAGLKGFNDINTIEYLKDNIVKFDNAEIKELDFVSIPHNESYELDLHRPYIDDIEIECECGGDLIRTKEVMDVWFDSGAMPFAQDHYPFENKEWVDKKGYPADFISEAIDQTRGWFYTLHAVGVLMGRGKAYKNVICLGHLLDSKGKKMSKSLGNIVDPWSMIEKYGVDTLRLWMYSVNQPGESKNFDEKTVIELHRQVFGLLYNVLAFYELYRDIQLETIEYKKSENILDKWILARLDELIDFTTKHLDDYKLLEPTRAIRDFIGDLSTWYLRRSRDRIKDGDKEAKQTLYFVLKNLSKIMAPFTPFAADDIWLKLKNEKDIESIHLAEWPKSSKTVFDIFSNGKNKILEEMKKVREIVTLGFEARQKAGIKVRQPLAKIQIKNHTLDKEYDELIKDELNIKEIKENKNIERGVLLDIEITEELKEEGCYREFVRSVQDMRKNIGLTPSDVISLFIETNDKGKKLIQKFEIDLLKVVLALKVEFKENEGESLEIDELVFKIQIEKR
ncbi:MAG: Isoleucine-tRNA ligase [Candidatus Nomurabacteria bacterium GW2011_GWE1_32_28]|uniref:Isoleucine--tRNA ligase n=1 Tax=Candidatus Nomurabacteria bacterium GW2011_GWF1_31_48 TaxID=1618767 RepID=A0A0F9YF35_9BACT|nr:MAG: Isoleucine-tRNA ligase [Candidatus Nomurabacteria bacterium GW2011_GWF2_30_133]KKP28438.1 MAG: Isoleucine-tRNA ligase [Candidatus Nomurabacteria bacterium GW2011_GWE2_31_40]KKP30018.1 MAG: Isoleucine-tRNA ligase [Candidatus Nomurabacteria bacterium GW2011_GWF1_31_48]KKP34537.1 MAG: Isoleucine-tRNA ligase [Candidatus Nomurabacteria bacterium GW2011_GWE1_32_28]HAS81064.1 isoleucine--tRNA ligase [Candidatus Nomurabacteria bacterium]